MNTYTWGEIQIESLKKMFLNNDSIYLENLDKMRTDNKYKIYLNAMPQAMNEGIAECMKRSRQFVKTLTFSQYPIENAIGNNYKTYRCYESTPLMFKANGVLSYYFEVDNICNLKIDVDGQEIVNETINKVSKPGKYKVFKGFIDNPDKKEVILSMSGKNPFNVRNVAMYTTDYDYMNGNIKYIPDYKPYNVYHLPDMAYDFYKIVKLYNEDMNHELINRNDYVLTDDNTLILNDNIRGNIILKYQPYVEKITLDTPDDELLNLTDEVAVILPLYIASQLYKDDDIAISTMYRNEFETAVDNLYPKYDDLEFICKSGWL